MSDFAKFSLESAQALFEINKLEESVALTYFSIYNILLALLFKTGIKSENHTASIILLKEIFDIDNEYIMFAKKERIDKQYYVDFKVTKDQVSDMLEKAEDFNKILFDFIAKIHNEDIKTYREKSKEIVGLD